MVAGIKGNARAGLQALSLYQQLLLDHERANPQIMKDLAAIEGILAENAGGKLRRETLEIIDDIRKKTRPR